MMARSVALAALLPAAFAQAQDTTTRTLDDFSDASKWRVVASDQVSGSIRQIEGEQGKALCLDYDFKNVSGYVGMQRDLPLDYPQNYRFNVRLRGDAPDNHLEFKLLDASGKNVWWAYKSRYHLPREWTSVRYKRREIGKAWGPVADPILHKSAKLEYTVSNSVGGKGEVCFDELTFTSLPADDGAPPRAKATASSASADAGKAVDGDPATAWRSQGGKVQRLTLDLGGVREFGGLTVRWAGNDHASRYAVALSEDGKQWRTVRTVVAGNGGKDWIALPESEARYIALSLQEGPGKSYALADVVLEPLAFAAKTNDLIKSIAKESPRGRFSRGFNDEQAYWTILGIDGGSEQGLIGEDGAIELSKSAPSIEPFVFSGGRWLSWADVQPRQSLQDGYLPIPSVEWKHAQFDLRITAFAQGEAENSQLIARYRLTNTGNAARDYVLALAVQPFQVNPARQDLNIVGGFSAIHQLSLRDGRVSINGKERVFSNARPDAVLATSFDAGMFTERLGSGDELMPGEAAASTAAVEDSTGLASGAMLYRIRLGAGESREVVLLMPLSGTHEGSAGFDAGKAQEQVAALWRDKLDRVHISVPKQGQALADTLRTATAHMLISRIGARLQPGTRSYARSWIRDGAMISEGLLRMGREDVVRDYVQWYAPYQFGNGKVPCCVDDRGSDPVPENDSHGELIFNIAEYYRYTGDRVLLDKLWPHVRGAFEYMETMRASERTEANRAVNPAFYGMMPISISHEGYSGNPVHSYWDNFWALRGYKDAVAVALWLGKAEDAKRMAAARDQFREDLDASLRAAAKLHKIDYLPGAAELGDFDATSTTIALAPTGEQARLPQDLMHNTFERYWREFVQRRDGQRKWDWYTPYEWRNVGAFVRLGWRERAWEAVEFFFKDRAPQPWNQWAEVVSRTPRAPFFLGDLPHAWVASDFVRSALDMFAYTRDTDSALVIAAGVPVEWFDGDGIAIERLRTPYGLLGYSLRRRDGTLLLELSDGMKLPPGGVVLPWPYKDAPGATRINGQSAQWQDGELKIRALPARIEIETLL